MIIAPEGYLEWQLHRAIDDLCATDFTRVDMTEVRRAQDRLADFMLAIEQLKVFT